MHEISCTTSEVRPSPVKGGRCHDQPYGRRLPSPAAAVSALLVAQAPASAQSKFACEPGETYIMNVMVSAHPYWVPVFEGFKQAATAMGCEVIFSGTPDYDITKQIASFEQDLVKAPEGHPAAPDAGRPVHRADQPRHRQRRAPSSPSRRTRPIRSASPTSPRTTSPRPSSRPRRSRSCSAARASTRCSRTRARATTTCA